MQSCQKLAPVGASANEVTSDRDAFIVRVSQLKLCVRGKWFKTVLKPGQAKER